MSEFKNAATNCQCNYISLKAKIMFLLATGNKSDSIQTLEITMSDKVGQIFSFDEAQVTVLVAMSVCNATDASKVNGCAKANANTRQKK